MRAVDKNGVIANKAALMRVIRKALKTINKKAWSPVNLFTTRHRTLEAPDRKGNRHG
jgi:hypothetical protein